MLFKTDEANLHHALKQHRKEYDSRLLNVMPDDELYMQELYGFVSDEQMQDVYRLTDSMYHDLSWLEFDLGRALSILHEKDSSIAPKRFYTMVTGDYSNYDRRVFCYDDDVVISIDHYILPQLQRERNYGIPNYIVNLCRKEYIVSDCIAEIVRAHTSVDEENMTMLDYMIAEGKALYTTSVAIPDVEDTILFRYTLSQLKWMKESEGSVWAWFIQNNLLFSTDWFQFHNFVDDAPKTNSFGEGSAPRTTGYIGYKIVEAYMKNTKSSISDLLPEPDSRAILQKSSYRP
ncbi:MAG: hypothetical protein IJ761_00595 [Bacteroidales bacterium]|nr:hypothetical protein [Bacteroidales bacterium]